MTEPEEKIDTQAIRAIHGSLGKLIVLLVGSLAFAAICLASALGWISEASETDVMLGLVGTAFFAFCAAVVSFRLAGASSEVVEISPEGIWDHRVTKEPVSWKNVTEVSIWMHLTGKFIQLKLDADAEERFMKSPLARSLRLANKALGFSGIAISAGTLDTDTETLAAMCEAYWRAHKGS